MFKLMIGALLVGGASGAFAQTGSGAVVRPLSPTDVATPLPATGSSTAPSRADVSAGSAVKWEIRASDVTLARTFERWAMAAGHKVKWDAARNFLVGATDTYTGSFEGAIVHVLSSPGIRFSDYPLEACIYANTPPLVRITRQGEQSRECAPSASQ